MRTVLITGASSGIGKSIAEKLLAEKHRVIGLARNVRELDASKTSFHAVSIDLSALDSLPERLKEIADRFATIDTLILCAGQGRFGELEQFSYDQIRSAFELNFTSQAFVVRAFIQELKRRKQGDIILIGSEAALTGRRKGSLYCAAKFALRGFAQSLRDECSRSGIRITLINPGMVKTDFFEELNFEPGNEAENAILPEDVAEMVCLVLGLRPGTVVDEINCTPLKHVIQFKSR